MLLFVLTVVVRFRHIIQTVVFLQNFHKQLSPSPLSYGSIQQLVLWSRIDNCDHPDFKGLNIEYVLYDWGGPNLSASRLEGARFDL